MLIVLKLLSVQELYTFKYLLQVIVHLLRNLDSMCAPAARAMVIWMMGEYSSIGSLISKMVPTMFKYLAGRFTLEADETKLQIINACIKVVVKSSSFGFSY